MDCQQFLSLFSDYFDGRAEASVLEEMEAHRLACERCRRYSRTYEVGRDLLRSMPTLDVPSDFRPRLDHRIFHLEDGASIARQSLGSGATLVSVIAVAFLVSLSAWAPGVDRPAPTVQLPEVVVVAPPAAVFTPSPASPTFSRNLSLFSTTEFRDGIWGDSHDLLREYSPILDRRREQALVRVGIE
jgi:anti-sigma factor RsiW